MSRSKKKKRKQRRRSGASMSGMIDAAVRETAQDFASSQGVCAYFAEQCWDELDSRTPRLVLNELAADLWRHHGQQVPEVVEALQALFDERMRHDAAVAELSDRLAELAEKEMAHVELTPFEPLVEIIKKRLIDAAARTAAQEGGMLDSASDH